MPKRKRPARRETSAGGVLFRRFSDGQVRFLVIRDSYRNWGFPKGHLERDEQPEEAARREVSEETGLDHLVLHQPIDVIDWFFRFRGRVIHKFCHFFLFESPSGDPTPQRDEGITECRWASFDRAVKLISYGNARGVLRQAERLLQALDPEPR